MLATTNHQVTPYGVTILMALGLPGRTMFEGTVTHDATKGRRLSGVDVAARRARNRAARAARALHRRRAS